MRYLAIDIGDRRTGFALGDSGIGLVQPLEVAEHPNTDVMHAAIDKVVHEHRPDAIVIGLPLNMDDTEGPAAKKMRGVAEAVGTRTGLPVHLFDERLTSFEADSRMAQSGKTHAEKKRVRDALAAAALLEDYLSSLG